MTELVIAAIGGCFAGAGVSASYYASRKDGIAPRFNKATHPQQWAVWNRLDKDKKGWITRDDLRKLCNRFDVPEMAPVLLKEMDPEGYDNIVFANFVRKYDCVDGMRKVSKLKLWNRTAGFGVAGNVAGHMAQAGEADAAAPQSTKPAALFTFYMPPVHGVADELADPDRLEKFPVAYSVIQFPHIPAAHKIQVEPELGLYVDIVYTEDRKKVHRLVPRRVAAFNDCSIRSMEGANKLSQKKNWGSGSKGISVRSFSIDTFAKGSFVDFLIIESYVKRNAKVNKYSVTAPCRNYMLFNDPLLDWIVDSINNQTDCDKWEEILPSLVKHDYPSSAWIALGAGEYTDWGNANDMQVGDEVVIIVYDEREFPTGLSPDLIDSLFDDAPAPKGMVHLHQTFV